MIAELHCHSIYSTGSKILAEGSDEPEAILKRAKQLGLGCLALTDHDNMDGYAKARKYAKKIGLILIPGEEITTREGHLLALGISEVVKPGLSVAESVNLVHRQGGITIAAHPFDRRRYGMGELAEKCDVIEGFNALSLDRMPNFYAMDFARRKSMPVSAGSDAHSIKMMGHGKNHIECHDVDSCLKAIKNGKNRIEGDYVRAPVIADWMIERMQYSYFYTTNYMKTNYKHPKKFVGLKLMRLVKRDYSKINYFFRLMGYAVLGGILTYSIAKNSIVNAEERLFGRD